MKIIFSLTINASLIFGKRTVNRFSNLNFSLLLAHLWESATAEHWSLLVARIYRRRSRILVSDYQNPAALTRFWQ